MKIPMILTRPDLNHAVEQAVSSMSVPTGDSATRRSQGIHRPRNLTRRNLWKNCISGLCNVAGIHRPMFKRGDYRHRSPAKKLA